MNTDFKKLTEAEWRERLTPEEYLVLREKGTEPAFCGLLTDTETPGEYQCKACKSVLFMSDTKYHSGSGWPSFYEAFDSNKVQLSVDGSHGMVRKEVICASCGSHLGHVFDDGPPPTGKRYCINSIALEFQATNG